ncbi:hypothetical protein [Pseudomonas sp. NPDC089534]|uniref:hypothetical protein n=1 Tax=Pseudomonas sp. NPDC089534 TaxID=3364468 RepID=UPI003810D5FB
MLKIKEEKVANIYKIYTSLKKTRGLDGEVNLTLSVEKGAAPKFLSEFAGGCGEIYDGYSTTTRKFEIFLDQDERRLRLSFSDGTFETLSPQFERLINPIDPLNQLKVVPLSVDQILLLSQEGEFFSKEYIVTGSNWWGRKS